MLRIIGGKFRSRLLAQPPLNLTRPTKDRVREAIFSAIGNKVINAVVLDLFAGSGAYGFEAISRGATSVYFNDSHSEAIKVIETNAANLKINQYKLTQLEGIKFIQFASENQLQFDIVFLDPPYAFEGLQNLFKQLFTSNLLKSNAVVVYESENKVCNFNDDTMRTKTYNYGRTYVHIGWKQ